MSKLTAIKIGNIEITTPVFLAPMSGVTDLPFRKLVKRLGGGMVVSEMIASNEALRQTKGTFKRITAALGEKPQMVQIIGHNPQEMADTAKFCADLGVDIVDINFGCPAKKITNKLCGSAIMRDISLARNILDEVVNAVDIPVTVKMRMGWDEKSLNAPEIAHMAEDIGIKMITVHGRTRVQKYNGNADWAYISNVKQRINIPLIVNGDINKFNDVDKALKLSKADGVMLGRGACGKPWFPAQVIKYINNGIISPPPTLNDQRDIVITHYNDIIAHHGVYHGVRLARKHLSWYLKNINDAAKYRQIIMRQDDPDMVIAAINQFYDNATKQATKAV